jgi:peptidoglycan/xylan/chitin deacetylase (PgdA/CDA1 family)
MRGSKKSAIVTAAILAISTAAAPAKAQFPPRPDVTPAPLQGAMPTIVTSSTESEPASLETPGAAISPEYSYPAPARPPLAAGDTNAGQTLFAPNTKGQHVYNKVQVDAPYVALTFDDGPHPTLTPKLLDLLKARNVKATFYVIGKNVLQYPEIVKRMVAEGHEVANHTWNHPALTKLSPAAVANEINTTTKAIIDVCGVAPLTMRPPYGATNASLNKRLAEEFGLPVILWSVDPQDWKIRRASHVSNHLIQHAKPGDILLAHDIHPSTIDAMPATLDALLAKGFKFATVSELIRMDKAGQPQALQTQTSD